MTPLSRSRVAVALHATMERKASCKSSSHRVRRLPYLLLAAADPLALVIGPGVAARGGHVFQLSSGDETNATVRYAPRFLSCKSDPATRVTWSTPAAASSSTTRAPCSPHPASSAITQSARVVLNGVEMDAKIRRQRSTQRPRHAAHHLRCHVRPCRLAHASGLRVRRRRHGHRLSAQSSHRFLRKARSVALMRASSLSLIA